MQRREEWAREHVGTSVAFWESKVWSDETGLNLYGPDGLASYWYELQKDPVISSTRRSGGGNVMIWACFF